MGRIFLLAITLLMSGIVMSCGGGNGSDGAQSKVVLINSSGPVSPAYMYEETITIENESMHIKRTGGDKIIVGDWNVTITQNEANDIKNLCNTINPLSDRDTVSDTGPIGGGRTEVHVSDTVYYNGWVNDLTTSQLKYHTFSLNVRNLTYYINSFIDKYGFNIRVH